MCSAGQNLITEIIIVTCTARLVCVVIKSCIGRCESESAHSSEKPRKALHRKHFTLAGGAVLLGFCVSGTFGDLEKTPERSVQRTRISHPAAISSADSGTPVSEAGLHSDFRKLCAIF